MFLVVSSTKCAQVVKQSKGCHPLCPLIYSQTQSQKPHYFSALTIQHYNNIITKACWCWMKTKAILFDVRTKQKLCCFQGLGSGGWSGGAWCQSYDLAIYLAISDNFETTLFFMPVWRLWWPNILAGWRGQVRVEATRDFFQTTCDLLICALWVGQAWQPGRWLYAEWDQDCKYFGKVKVILCILATVLFKFSVLDKAGMAKDLERYMLLQ